MKTTNEQTHRPLKDISKLVFRGFKGVLPVSTTALLRQQKNVEYNDFNF